MEKEEALQSSYFFNAAQVWAWASAAHTSCSRTKDGLY